MSSCMLLKCWVYIFGAPTALFIILRLHNPSPPNSFFSVYKFPSTLSFGSSFRSAIVHSYTHSFPLLILIMISAIALISLFASSALAIYLPPSNLLLDQDSTEYIVASLAASNNHGAPIPPESAGSTPGWYYGDDPGAADGLPWMKDVVS